MESRPGVKAVWVDAKNQRVSFAVEPGQDAGEVEREIGRIVGRHRPEDAPACAEDPWRVACEVCEIGVQRPMPPGVRIIAIPGAGVMLERETCPTAPRFWRWTQVAWVKLVPRHRPTPEEVAAEGAEWRYELAAALLCGGLLLGGWLAGAWGGPRGAACSPWLLGAACAAGAWFPARETFGLLRKRILDVHFLMLAVAAGAAFIGHLHEGAVLLFLFSFSGALEGMVMWRTEREIRSLFQAAPKEAVTVAADGQERRVAVEALEPGMLVRVRPGEQFPADGEIATGATAADESSLTGEAAPVDKQAGDNVFGGTLNVWGAVDFRVARPASESALARVIRLIREAQESKAPSQRFTDRFGTGYTYLILGVSVAMFLVWWLGMGAAPFADTGAGRSAFYRAMTLLVVASPCALVLSIPSAVLAGIACGARHGVLFRGGSAIERLGEVTRVALDKTGTLTTGDLAVARVEAAGGGDGKAVLACAAALARLSAHPVSRAIQAHARRAGVRAAEAAEFKSIAGQGVEGMVGGNVARMGRREMFAGAAWVGQLPRPEPGLTETLVECGEARGRLILRDEVREESAAMVRALRARGLAVTMLTGDRAEAAGHAAKAFEGLEVRAGLAPEGKVAAIREWTAQGERVAMVGDGVNDAPSLAAAHVSLGMGMRGSDAALEQADVVLAKDRIEGVVFAYELSRKARTVIRQNLALSLGVIGVMMGAALGSWVPLTAGVIAHEGSTVVVVLNSLRLLFFRFGGGK